MRLEDELKTKGFPSEQTKAVINVLFTASHMHGQMCSHMRPFGLSHEQYNVLRILRGQHPNPVAQKDILHRMIDRSSNVTRILAKLKDKELVQIGRSKQDRREYEILLTEAGLALLCQIDQSLEQSPPRISLSESEAFHLNALLDKLRENF